MSSRLRGLLGLGALVEVVLFILVAAWIGWGWTILAALATSAMGWVLLARQGTKTLTELRLRAQERRPPGTALGDAGLIAAGGLLMVLPGFLGDVLGLLCLLPGTRRLPRALIARAVLARLPDRARGPLHVRATRTAQVDPQPGVHRTASVRGPAPGWIEGDVVEGDVVEGDVVERRSTGD